MFDILSSRENEVREKIYLFGILFVEENQFFGRHLWNVFKNIFSGENIRENVSDPVGGKEYGVLKKSQIYTENYRISA